MKKRILSLALALLLALSLAVPSLAADVSDYPVYWSNVNSSGVMQGGDGWYYPDFEVPGTDLYVQAVSTYHYNHGLGVAPGWIAIYDWDTDVCLGRWQAAGRDGNRWWDVYPGIALEGGRRYYIVTTDEEGWSYNAQSGSCCFAEVRGYTTGGDVPVSGGGGGNIPPSRQTAAVEVTVNGAYVSWTDAWPFIDENNRTMVPLRAVAEAMGLSVSWDGARREASFTDGARAIYFPIDSRTAYSGGGGQIPMDTAAVIVADRTYAPVRYLAEFFGFNVDWDGETRTVHITGAWEDPYASDDYSFRGMGVDLNVDDHGQKAYRTVTELGTPITCYARVSSYRVFTEDDAMPGFDGYEWRVMTIDVTSPSETDSVKQQYFFTSNYYNIKLHKDSYAVDGDGVQHFRGTMNGAYIDYTLWYRVENNNGDGFRLVITAQVPTGFDGLVVGLMNAGLADTAEHSYLYQFYSDPQDFALFRMK